MYNLFITYLSNSPVLTWSPYKDTESYVIYRGESNDTLEKIGETQLLQYKDESIEANIFYKQDRVQYYYQIKSKNSKGEETGFTDIVNLRQNIEYPIYGVLKEIVRRNELQLNKISGEQCEFYLKKGSGKHCKECYNETLKDISSQKQLCPVCYNTGYEGGFVKVSGLIRIKNAQSGPIQTNWGIKIESIKQGWMSVYPIVQNGDWVKTLQGEIYEFSDMKQKRVKGFITIQSGTLVLLETGHRYYEINI